MKPLLLSALLFCVGFFPAHGASDYAKARLVADPSRLEDGHFWAGVHFTLEPGWHIYWMNPGDSGLPTSLQWSLPDGWEAEAIHWPMPERIRMGDITNFGYGGEVTLPVPIRAQGAADEGTLRVKADWLVCKDICIPESAELSYDLADAAPEDATLLQRALESVPVPFTGAAHAVLTGENLTIALKLPGVAEEVTLFPVTEGWLGSNRQPKLERRGDWLLLHLDGLKGKPRPAYEVVIAAQVDGKATRLQFAATRADTLPAEVPAPASPPAAKAGIGLWLALGLALLGGMILNLMPCVLPVLALKSLALTKKAHGSRREAALSGLSYTAGVLASFALVGAGLLALQSAGEAVGWGYQLQSPGFVFALLILVALVSYNLMGLFELPMLMGGAASRIAARHPAADSFFTGALSVALATPCSAPFMASALGAALTRPPAQAMLIFLALGLGLALPYLLMSFSPALQRLLPKPGPWMQRFREFLAFPMAATCVWLLWVLTEQAGAGALLTALLVLLGLAFVLWGVKQAHTPLWRRLWWLALIGVLAAGIAYTPRSLSVDASATVATDAFSEERLADLRAAGTPVFVDATADWCITCKYNERVALHTKATQALFKERGIVLMVADWTRRDDAITAWLASFGRSGVPLYVYYPPGDEPRVLPQLLTPGIVREAVSGE